VIKKNFWQIIIGIGIFLSVFWAGKGLFKYSFYQTHDIARHLARSYDAIISIKEGQFPLRWSGLLNYNCGTPTFTFYFPGFYYLVAAIYPFVKSVMSAIKVVSFLSLLVGTLFFFLWMKEETKDKWAALAGSLLYLYAPYTFLLIYVRGSPEYLSFGVLPVVLYFYAKAFSAKGDLSFLTSCFLAAVTGGFLAISHNIVSLFIMPVILLYLLIKFWQSRGLKVHQIMLICFSFISAFGLGAFFIFPAFLEQKFTKLAIPIFNYQHHFPTLAQVIYSKWGFGDSAIGIVDDAMSFQLGFAQWAVLLLVAIWLIFNLVKKVPISKYIWVVVFWVLSLFFLYLVLPISIPFWQKVRFLQTIQFSWRLLGICVFTLSALFSFWLSKVKSKFVYWPVLIGVVLLAFLGNRNHLLSQPVLESELSLYRDLDNLCLNCQKVPAFAETTLPSTASQSCFFTTPLVESGESRDKLLAQEITRGSTFGSIKLDINKDKLMGNQIILNLSYFPEIFHIKINEKDVPYEDCSGRVCVKTSDLDNGINNILWKVGETELERFFDLVSLSFFGTWVFILVYFLPKHKIK